MTELGYRYRAVVPRRLMVTTTAERVAVMCCGGVWYSALQCNVI